MRGSRIPKGAGKGRAGGGGAAAEGAGADVEPADAVVGGRVALGKLVPLAFDRLHLDHRRLAEVPGLGQGIFQLTEVVAIDRADIVKAHLFKKGVVIEDVF